MSGDDSQAGYADWDAFYLDNVSRVHRMMHAKVGNRADAEDLTAEVFFAVWRPLRLDVSRAEIRAYLGATARTVLAGFWRRRAAIEVTAITADDVTTLVEDGRDVDEEPRPVDAVLAGLPDRYRRILELRFLEGCSVKESAREIGVSVANAKVLQHRALRMAAVSRRAGEA